MARRLILLVILASIAMASQWWVHSEMGDDSNAGSCKDSAFASLGAATSIASPGDTMLIAGNFAETLTLTSDNHEGCLITSWPDSGKWFIDGDSARRCVDISYVGYRFEKGAIIENMIGSMPSDYIIYSYYSNIYLDKCSLDCTGYGAGTVWSKGNIYIDSSYVKGNSGNMSIYITDGVIYISNSKLYGNHSVYGSIKAYNASSVISNSNKYIGESGVYVSGGYARFDCDLFSVNTYGIYISDAASFEMNRCLLIGGTGVKTHYEVVNGDIINCTFDSMSTGIYADRTTCNLNLMNTIFNNCDVGLRELCDVNCCGTIIYDCEYDTVDIAKTIEYFDLDPQIDSTRTARADSALTIGKNQMGQLFAPIYDKKGKWFRSNEGIPAIGYASPYESESWPQNENNEILWGIKTSGRSMK